jgi:tetratricopeptide (TPR) repeat protein
MMNRLYFLMITAMVAAIAGCATAPAVNEQTPEASSGAATQTAEPPELAVEGEFPPQVLYQLLVAEVARQRGQYGVAVANYIAAAKESRDARIARGATRTALFVQDLNSALEAASLWVELAPDDPEARQSLAPLLLTFGRAPEAVENYERFIALSQDRPDNGLLQISMQLMRQGNRVAAMSVMEQLLSTRKDNPFAWLAHAQLAMRQAQFDSALASVEKALDLKGDWARAVVLKAQIMGLKGDKEEALAYLKTQRDENFPDDLNVSMTYARLLVETQHLDEGLAEFESLAEQAPRNAEVLYTAGVMALRLDQLDKARDYLEKVLSLGKRRLESNYYLGRLYEQKGDVDQALRHYFAVRHGEFHLNAHARAANLLAGQGKLDQARELLHAIKVNSEEERHQLILVEGELLRRAGKYDEAYAFYSKHLEENPDDTSLRYARALVAERINKLAQAEEDLRAIIQREPSNAQALNALGYTLADRTDRYEEALGYIERALEVDPGDAAIIDSMGWVQYRMGNLAEAVENLRKALKIVKDPEIAAHLGEVLWVMGDKEGALKVWEEFLKQFPEHEALLKVMERFGL